MDKIRKPIIKFCNRNLAGDKIRELQRFERENETSDPSESAEVKIGHSELSADPVQQQKQIRELLQGTLTLESNLKLKWTC